MDDGKRLGYACGAAVAICLMAAVLAGTGMRRTDPRNDAWTVAAFAGGGAVLAHAARPAARAVLD